MEHIYLNPESQESSKPNLIERFGQATFNLFSQFALGGAEAYAQQKGKGYKLTQKGVREYHRMQSELLQTIFNMLIVILTVILAICSVVSAIK